MKIIVIGTGKVGSLLIEQLASEGHQIVAIDRNEKKLLDIQNSLDVLCLAGNAADRNLLIEAGTGTADLVIAATNHSSPLRRAMTMCEPGAPSRTRVLSQVVLRLSNQLSSGSSLAYSGLSYQKSVVSGE